MENTAGAAGDLVSLMTLHSAKGLEFDTVFLPGWEEGLFPNQRSMEEHGRAGLEEERRLAYVGLTRARRRVFVSHAAVRRIHGQWQATLPSRFLAELPADHADTEMEPGLYPRPGGLADAWAPSPVFQRPRFEAMRMTLAGRNAALAVPARPARPPGDGFAAGDRIFHQKFGAGTVRAVEGNKLAIAFDKAGDKMVIDSFVEKA
jgi:DNA helicase-2/ATP-dependent DNA helicase PcrA